MNKICDEKINELAQMFISSLEKEGTWLKPWQGTGPRFPTNLYNNHVYQGFNFMMLYMTALDNGWPNTWLTFKQKHMLSAAKDLDIRITKGSIGTHIIRPVEWVPKGGDPEKPIIALKNYAVFNFAQLEGEIAGLMPEPIIPELTVVDQIIERHGIDLNHADQPRSYFTPSTDKIVLPLPQSFDSSGAYYSVLLHEMVHWTGTKDRLARDKEDYAFEELVAEIGATMLCSHFGIDNEVRHVEYINSWVSKLKDKPSAIYQACQLAQKACNYLIKED